MCTTLWFIYIVAFSNTPCYCVCRRGNLCVWLGCYVLGEVLSVWLGCYVLRGSVEHVAWCYVLGVSVESIFWVLCLRGKFLVWKLCVLHNCLTVWCSVHGYGITFVAVARNKILFQNVNTLNVFSILHINYTILQHDGNVVSSTWRIIDSYRHVRYCYCYPVYVITFDWLKIDYYQRVVVNLLLQQICLFIIVVRNYIFNGVMSSFDLPNTRQINGRSFDGPAKCNDRG